MLLTRDRSEAVLSNISGNKIIVVGDLMLDRYVWGEVDRISPEAPVPILRLTGESSNLGGAANVAANAGALGAEVALFGFIGDDDEGKLLMSDLEKSGFDSSGVVVVLNRPTITKTRVIAGSQHVVRIDKEDASDLDSEIEKQLLDKFEATLEEGSCVILEDYNKGTLTNDVISGIIKACHKKNVLIGVDPKHTNFWSYKGVTLFKPNLRELENAVGYSCRDRKKLEQAGNEVIRELKPEHLLVTRGKEGMALFTGGKVHFLDTQAMRVHDVSGAGDTVIATLMAALIGGADIFEAAALANCAAGIVIAEVGAVPVNVDKLKRACS